MLQVSFAVKTVRRVRPAKSTERGNEVLSYGTGASRTDIPGCIVQPGSTSENNQDRSAALAQLIIHAPIDTDLTEEDHIEYRGKEYEIFGEIGYVESATGAADHLYIQANRWTG